MELVKLKKQPCPRSKELTGQQTAKMIRFACFATILVAKLNLVQVHPDIYFASYRLLFQAHRGEAPGEDEEHQGGVETDREGRVRQGIRYLHRG